MRNLFIAILLLLLSSIGIYAQKEINVIIIGGQSNATGQGYIRNIPSSFEVDTSVLFYYSRYLNRGEGGETWTGLCQASETKDKFGVELSLGTAIKRYLPNKEFALIKHALSGSNLFAQWNPGNRDGEKRGAEYKKMLDTVNKGLKELKEKGYNPVIRAMVWQQGEADVRDNAGLDNSRNYGENLRNFIMQVRNDFSAPDMLFVYGEVMPMAAERFPGRNLVRQAQVDVSEGACSPLSVKNTILVEGDDLQMRRSDYRTPMPLDDVHLGTYGILTLGERFAKVVYENSNNW